MLDASVLVEVSVCSFCLISWGRSWGCWTRSFSSLAILIRIKGDLLQVIFFNWDNSRHIYNVLLQGQRLFFLLDFLRPVLRLLLAAAELLAEVLFLVSFSLTVSSASEFWLESGSLRLSAINQYYQAKIMWTGDLVVWWDLVVDEI